ncbi:MAG: hypothetical protein KDA22_09600 [Phycisphaerales bacterium]|nr:hypothetical protein [Phycisphaerales bacterium]
MGKWISILFVVVVLVTNIVGAIAQHQAKRRAEERKARELMQRRAGAGRAGQPTPAASSRPAGGYTPPGLQTRVGPGASSGSSPTATVPLPADVLADRRQQRLAELQRKQDVAAARRMAKVDRASQSPVRRAEEPLEARIAREHAASDLPPHERLGRLQRSTERGAIGSRRVGSGGRAKRKRERREPAPRGTRGRVKGGALETLAGTALREVGARKDEPHWLRQRLASAHAWRDAIILREVLGPARGTEPLDKIGM